MASGVRIERCPDQAAATQRTAALKKEGFQVQTIVGPAIVVSSNITIVGGKAVMNDTELSSSAPVVVIGILP
jgi:thiazole synthase ThiGH ThiG subunit